MSVALKGEICAAFSASSSWTLFVLGGAATGTLRGWGAGNRFFPFWRWQIEKQKEQTIFMAQLVMIFVWFKKIKKTRCKVMNLIYDTYHESSPSKDLTDDDNRRHPSKMPKDSLTDSFQCGGIAALPWPPSRMVNPYPFNCSDQWGKLMDRYNKKLLCFSSICKTITIGVNSSLKSALLKKWIRLQTNISKIISYLSFPVLKNMDWRNLQQL